MNGIQFITDARSRKTAAVIDLKKHSALWEDIEDVLVSRLAAPRKTHSARKGEGWPDRKRQTARLDKPRG